MHSTRVGQHYRHWQHVMTCAVHPPQLQYQSASNFRSKPQRRLVLCLHGPMPAQLLTLCSCCPCVCVSCSVALWRLPPRLWALTASSPSLCPAHQPPPASVSSPTSLIPPSPRDHPLTTLLLPAPQWPGILQRPLMMCLEVRHVRVFPTDVFLF